MSINLTTYSTGKRLLTVIVAVLLAAGCAASRPLELTGPDLHARIESGNPPAIVDVRSADEFASGHIPGALHMPFWSVFSRHDQLSVPPDAPLLLYCEHGPRATMAKLAFSMMGYEDIVYLDGDLEAWKAAELPLEKSPASKP
jgi:hydroxyacylglutathione hydrolase